MKKAVWLIVLTFFMMPAISLAATFRVVTEETMIRKDPRFFAPAVTRVRYGEALQEQGREGDWLKVIYKGTSGWVHVSAVQQQKVEWSSLAGGRATETTRDEVALAGKGFSPEVEKTFREKNQTMRYDLVARVEARQVSEKELKAFIQEGKLREPGGAP